MANKIVVNRGKRIYSLDKGADGKPRTLLPGGSIETLDDKEAAHLLRYTDIEDINTVSPQMSARIDATQREIDRLTAENAKLRKQQEAAPPVVAPTEPAAGADAEDKDADEDKGGSKSKKKGR